MEEGYYVPDISEFHKGFQYQQIELASVDGGPKKLQWVDKIYNGSEFHYVDIGIGYKKIRCKYLDKTDIESLGWIETPQCYVGDGKLRGYRLIVNKENPAKIRMWNHFTGETYFRGIIKNKSELKKLMSQLEILDETLI